MSRKHRVELQAVQQFSGATHTHFIYQLTIGNGKLIGRVGFHLLQGLTTALAQRLNAIVFFREISQMKERGECSHHHLSALNGKHVEKINRFAKCFISLS